jgi:hemoglobin
MPALFNPKERLAMKMKLWASSVVVAALFVLGGCMSDGMMMKKSLYDRLGGQPAVTAVVDDFVGNVAGDSRINGRFANANIPRLKKLLVEQISAGTGGPVSYTGRDMKTAHAGMKITDAEFNALVEDLIKTLDKFKVPEQEKGELLGILGPMKGDIVGK